VQCLSGAAPVRFLPAKPGAAITGQAKQRSGRLNRPRQAATQDEVLAVHHESGIYLTGIITPPQPIRKLSKCIQSAPCRYCWPC
jgi:hypothetical protein